MLLTHGDSVDKVADGFKVVAQSGNIIAGEEHTKSLVTLIYIIQNLYFFFCFVLFRVTCKCKWPYVFFFFFLIIGLHICIYIKNTF